MILGVFRSPEVGATHTDTSQRAAGDSWAEAHMQLVDLEDFRQVALHAEGELSRVGD